MGELEGEDGLPPATVGPQSVHNIIEGIVNTLVESEVIGQVGAVSQLEQLKLFNLPHIKEGYLYFILILDLVTQLLLLRLHLTTTDIPQDLNGLALIVK